MIVEPCLSVNGIQASTLVNALLSSLNTAQAVLNGVSIANHVK